ncbi:polysaccharide deacetylase family protein [Cohnella panacarvi]|uniref:polysaccharide deacetylase family protein n=1 Tax=Cohnella panacarvi TaxID=400776 RepID=UPI00047D0E93|nr:polysaccharide deacetylase family protein [Cohnella panacarvi]
MNTATQLGYGSGDRLLIVNADDFGLCKSTNDGILLLLEENAISSTTIMMTCPWSEDAAASYALRTPSGDIGVHWTLTSEWNGYRWGPLCRTQPANTLSGRNGWFPATVGEFEKAAAPEQVRAELIAQTEAALAMGLPITHADNHMGSLYGIHTGQDLLPVVFDVCAMYGLPFRLPRQLQPALGRKIPKELERRARQRVRQAEDNGIVLPDYLTGLEFHRNSDETYDTMKAAGIEMLRGLLPGVTEWISHPSHVTEELRSFHGEPDKRGMELAFWRDPDVRAVLDEEKILLIGWNELKRLQSSLSF